MALHLRATDKVNTVNEDEELRKRGYLVGITLGEGSYAKVKSALAEKLDKKVAIKIINRKRAPKDFQTKFLPREMEVLKKISHPNIIQLMEIMQFNGKVYMIFEMAGHGDLLEYIKLRGALPEEKARPMFYQLCSAIGYLHSLNIVHRDLKCENILLDAKNNVKVSDFGFSRFLKSNELSKTFCGSAAYAAPEILQGIPYTGPAYDVWSMGVILYIMVCGSMPYDDSNIKKMIKYQTERKVGFSRSKTLSEEVKLLIHSMLEASVHRRVTIRAIVNGAWLMPYMVTLKFEDGTNVGNVKPGQTVTTQDKATSTNTTTVPVSTAAQNHAPQVEVSLRPSKGSPTQAMTQQKSTDENRHKARTYTPTNNHTPQNTNPQHHSATPHDTNHSPHPPHNARPPSHTRKPRNTPPATQPTRPQAQEE